MDGAVDSMTPWRQVAEMLVGGNGVRRSPNLVDLAEGSSKPHFGHTHSGRCISTSGKQVLSDLTCVLPDTLLDEPMV